MFIGSYIDEVEKCVNGRAQYEMAGPLRRPSLMERQK